MTSPSHSGTATRGGTLAATVPDVVAPGDDGWDAARLPWNLAAAQQPDLVVRAHSERDVQDTVRWAAANGLRVVPQGTGHAALGLGQVDDGVLLRTRELDWVVIDPDGQTATVGSGVAWSDVVAAARPHGLTGRYGTDPSVGVAGFTLGGGISWFGRRHGLASSALVRARVVTGRGEVVECDRHRHPELFWALQGGGGGFGVVTSLTFGLLPVGPVYAGSVWFPIDRAGEVLDAYLAWTGDLTDDVTSAIRFMRLPDAPVLPAAIRGQAFVIVSATMLLGDTLTSQAAVALADRLRALGPVQDAFAVTTSDGVAGVHLAPSDPTPTAGDGMLLADLPATAAGALLDRVGPGADTALAMVELRQLGGALGRPDPRAGALSCLPGRFAVMAGNMVAGPGSRERIEADAAGLRVALAAQVAPRDYLNFRESPGGPERYFDAPTRLRLEQVKREHDPDHVIRSGHVSWPRTAPR